MPHIAAAFIAAVLFVSGSFYARAAANETSVAVVIGNSNYTADRIPKVDYAHKDAEAFKRYPVDTLYANLAKLPARSVTVYLDACFSGDSPKGMLINATSGITVTPRLPTQRSKLTILTAATGDQVASWDLENRHGLFTEHLLAALYGAADTQRYGAADGNVTVGEVEKYLARNMTYAAKRAYGRIQHATINGSPDMVLAALGANHPKRPVLVAGTSEVAALPPPSVQVAEMDASYLVVKRANVRSGPSTTFSKVSQLSPGVAVDVTGKVRGKDWYRITLADGGQGYVWGRLLSERKPPAKQEAASPKADTKPVVGAYPKDRQPGDTFKDCDDCPEMVVVPEGEFRMGDLRDGRSNDEKPVHTVQIGYVLAVGRFEVTYSEWDACLAGGGCGGYLFASSAQEHSQSYRPEVGEGVF